MPQEQTPPAPLGPPAEISPVLKGEWWIYHLQYEKAREIFDELIASDPQNPQGYFYRTATDWWELAQDIEVDPPEVRERFEKDVRRTVDVAEKLLKTAKNPKVRAQALLAEGGARGLHARWLVTRDSWSKAYSEGKHGARLLRQAIKLDPELSDAYLGLGIYDYYTATLPGLKGFFAKMLMHGSTKRGMEELHTAIEKSPNARVEAILFLIHIYVAYENKHDEALTYAETLRSEFPQSPAMHILKIRVLSDGDQWHKIKDEAQDFISKCEKEEPFYSRAHISPGRYFLGQSLLYGDRDTEGCLAETDKILESAHKKSQWATFAHLLRGQAYDVQGKRKQAVQEYSIVRQRPSVWESVKKAKRYLNQPFELPESKI